MNEPDRRDDLIRLVDSITGAAADADVMEDARRGPLGDHDLAQLRSVRRLSEACRHVEDLLLTFVTLPETHRLARNRRPASWALLGRILDMSPQGARKRVKVARDRLDREGAESPISDAAGPHWHEPVVRASELAAMSEVLAGVALLLRTDALEEGTAAEVERYAESLAALATLYPGPVHHATGVHGLARPSREAMAQGWAAQIRAAVVEQAP